MKPVDIPGAVFHKMMETDYFSQWMNIRLEEIGAGKCRLRMEVRKEMLNGFGIIHGGVTFALADSTLAFASNSHNRLSVSLNVAMSYVKSAKEGDVLVATATEQVLGGKTGTYDVEVVNRSSGQKIALFRGTVYRTSKEVIETDSKEI